MLQKHQRVSVLFPSGVYHEGTIIGVPGETVEIYGNDEILPPNEYRVIYFIKGYGYRANFPLDRIVPLA